MNEIMEFANREEFRKWLYDKLSVKRWYLDPIWQIGRPENNNLWRSIERSSLFWMDWQTDAKH